MIQPTSGFWPALLFGGAFLAAVFFQGAYADLLCVTLALLLLWAVFVVWHSYEGGFRIPASSVALCLSIYWLWLAVSAVWGRVGYLGTLTFWWLTPLPLVFWLYLLSPAQETLWRWSYGWAVAIAAGLALYAGIQHFVYALEPSATFLNRQSFAALLNLVAIPLCGYFLITQFSHAKWRAILLGAVIFLFAITLALIEGRGATLSGALALAVLLAVALRFVPRTRIVALVAIITFAFLIGSQFGREGIGQRLEGVASNPWEAGSTRLIIWQQSWEMLKDAPWMGVGLGHYALYYPRYRDPSDSNAGFFVHNDYLQIWIEAGLPGLLLLLAVLGAVLLLYVRVMRRSTTAGWQKIELTGLFAGLVAIATHSFLDFNLYVLSILVLAGLMLGRLHQRGAAAGERYFLLQPSKHVTEARYRWIASLLIMLPMLYSLTLGISSFEYRRALDMAEQQRDFDGADAALSRAIRLYPYADNLYVSKADVLRHVISVAPATAQVAKQQLYKEADELLRHAARLNPLRPVMYAVRARLYEQNPEFVGADRYRHVVDSYQRALELDPRNYQVRTLYARFLIAQGKASEAQGLLEDGVKWYYWQSPSLIPYYSLVASTRSASGDSAGASAMQARVRDLVQQAERERQQVRNDSRLSLWPFSNSSK